MEKKEDYEKLYDMLLGYEQEIHKKNQKRIRIGLRCLIIIPLIFLALLFCCLLYTSPSPRDCS